MARNPNTPCVDCGKLCWPTRSKSPRWTPPAEHICRDCRRARTRIQRQAAPADRRVYMRDCADCGRACWGQRCRSCADAAMRVHTDKAERKRVMARRRAERDRLAPGSFTQTARRGLRDLWMKQGRICIYCNEKRADTVDHIIPLSLGGTNYEGNLAPACFECNRLKQDNLLSAWRYGVRVHRWRTEVEVPGRMYRKRNAPKQLELTLIPACKQCGAECPPGRRTFCSDECSTISNRAKMRVRMRNKYRTQVGIPLDKPTPRQRKADIQREFSKSDTAA